MKKKTAPAKAATPSTRAKGRQGPSRTFRFELRHGLMSSTFNVGVWTDTICMTGWRLSRKS